MDEVSADIGVSLILEAVRLTQVHCRFDVRGSDSTAEERAKAVQERPSSGDARCFSRCRSHLDRESNSELVGNQGGHRRYSWGGNTSYGFDNPFNSFRIDAYRIADKLDDDSELYVHSHGGRICTCFTRGRDQADSSDVLSPANTT